jgi:K+-transporting ATPase ATPase A chain
MTPLAGLVFIFQMLTGEVIFGGAGAGLYGMALYAINFILSWTNGGEIT